MRALAAVSLVFLAALVVACTAVPAPDRADECLQLFRAFDRVADRYPGGGVGRISDRRVPPPDLARAGQRLIVADCLTRTSDLDGMEAYAAGLEGFRITDGPTAIRPRPVHLGILTSITDEVRVTIVFRGLGYNSRGVGAIGLGRRIYIGPFRSQEAADQAIALAREAGFIAPFVPANTRF